MYIFRYIGVRVWSDFWTFFWNSAQLRQSPDAALTQPILNAPSTLLPIVAIQYLVRTLKSGFAFGCWCESKDRPDFSTVF